MKKFFTNKVLQFVLVAALVVSSFTISPATANAATMENVFSTCPSKVTLGDKSNDNIKNLTGKATYSEGYFYKEKNLKATDSEIGYPAIKYTINVDMDGIVYFDAVSSSYGKCCIVVYDAFMTEMVYVSDGMFSLSYDSNLNKYYGIDSAYLTKGTYTVFTAFESPVTADVSSFRIVTDITVGFKGDTPLTQQYSLYNWSSSNTKVATVKDGVVTMKKTGKAIITVDVQGIKVSFEVKGVSNKYTEKNITSKNAGKSGVLVQIVSASYDKKGNLKVKARVFNNSYYSSVKTKTTKLTIKANGKKYATMSSSKKLTIKRGKAATISFTVKKSKLKSKKKVDLRMIDYSVKGSKYTF